MSKILLTQLEQRHDTAAQWTSFNPTLRTGEIGFDTTNNLIKIGNNNTAWNALPYLAVPQATSTTYGGIIADPITSDDKQPVHIDTETGKLYTKAGGGGGSLPGGGYAVSMGGKLEGNYALEVRFLGILHGKFGWHRYTFSPQNRETLPNVIFLILTNLRGKIMGASRTTMVIDNVNGAPLPNSTATGINDHFNHICFLTGDAHFYIAA